MMDEAMIRSHVQPQQTSQQQRCGGHGALSCSGRTPRRSFPRRLLFNASRTLNQGFIYIKQYVNEWSFKLWQLAINLIYTQSYSVRAETYETTLVGDW